VRPNSDKFILNFDLAMQQLHENGKLFWLVVSNATFFAMVSFYHQGHQ